jgi:hypothetical protein
MRFAAPACPRHETRPAGNRPKNEQIPVWQLNIEVLHKPFAADGGRTKWQEILGVRQYELLVAISRPAGGPKDSRRTHGLMLRVLRWVWSAMREGAAMYGVSLYGWPPDLLLQIRAECEMHASKIAQRAPAEGNRANNEHFWV